MKLIRRVTGTVLTVFSFLFAQDSIELSGSLPDHLTSDKSYLVVADIFVSPGSSVTIDAGTVFMFESFTGLHVQGSVYVKGDPEKPVVFTSKNDKQYNPNSTVDAAPFDWNGIDIYETAIGTNFTQCIIRFSVYGIRSQTEHLKITNSVFSNNGKADLTIKGEKKDIISNETFSFGLSADTVQTVLPEPEQLAVVDKTVKDDPVKASIQTPENNKKRSGVGIQIMRYTSLAVAIASGAASAWYYLNDFEDADKKLKDLSELDDNEKKIYTSKDWENAERKRNRKLALCLAGAGGAVIGVGFFALSFAF